MATALRTSLGLVLAALVSAYVYADAVPIVEHAAAGEPAVFVGMVEVTADGENSVGVLLSTATEEVVIADNAIAEQLMTHEGEVVVAEGRLIEAADGPPTLVVHAFRVLGAARSPRSGVIWVTTGIQAPRAGMDLASSRTP